MEQFLEGVPARTSAESCGSPSDNIQPEMVPQPEKASEPEKKQPEKKKKIQTLKEVAAYKMSCISPEKEIAVEPKWVCFETENNNYKNPSYATLHLENPETYPVTFNIKAREKIFRVQYTTGILAAGEKRTVNLILMTSEDWPLSIHEYTQKRLKVAIETLRIPEEIQPKTLKDGTQMSRNIWKRSYNEWPLERLYTKVNVSLAPPVYNNPPTNAHTIYRI